ncbi:VOC family protein [Flavobacterium hydatis]|uniref:Glyoxalase n=1 Tax=Flavobacterium hydatis TaxID=991 RepID=A0A085ZWR1_FLAHY|nr:VOC family protein [Flavobacterium hydatis]KFF08875.1 glyoxalase [Flavobacterium hydatis]OXA95852.1 VOC family protein [Flavobacterium hydatis]
MVQLNSYLTFNGNCREAMTFYKACLGGELELQTIADSPMAEDLPQKMKKCILHATLKSDSIVIMGSDMAPENFIKGNAVAMMLTFNSEDEIRKTYAHLAKDGYATHSLEMTFFGALFGHLTDKFGHQWMFYYSSAKN